MATLVTIIDLPKAQQKWLALGNSTRPLLDDTNNLVLYDNNFSPLWSTQTNGTGKLGRSRLVMQNDNNLVLYDLANKVLYVRCILLV